MSGNFQETNILRSAKCDREGCEAVVTEAVFGEGFHGWQYVPWLVKDGKPVLICPACVKKINDFIKGITKEA